MVDFKKLLAMSPEERRASQEESDKKYYGKLLQKNLNELAASAKLRRSFLLSEDPVVRFDRSGDPYAILRVLQTPESQGFDSAIIKPLANEDERDFANRIETLSRGDRVEADGDMQQRKWKDMNDKWQSRNEFVVALPVSPESLKPALPEGVEFPLSEFQKRQASVQKLAFMQQQQRGPGLG